MDTGGIPERPGRALIYITCDLHGAGRAAPLLAAALLTTGQARLEALRSSRCVVRGALLQAVSPLPLLSSLLWAFYDVCTSYEVTSVFIPYVV